MMKLIESWIQIEPNTKKMNQPVDVWAVEMSMDSFGKYHTTHKVFESFSRKELAFKYKDRLENEAKNLLNNFIGWKL